MSEKHMRKSSVIIEKTDNDVMKRVKRLRAYAGLTQDEFANKYGIPAATYRKWENGNRIPPDYVITLLERVIESEKDD